MNARLLQDALVEDIAELFKNRQYTSPHIENACLQVFSQNLPKRESEEDDDPFPYVIVRLDGGSIESQTAPYKVSVLLLVGIFDDDPANQGHRAVLEIFEELQRHYEETPLVARQFIFDDPFEWALQDEESYPYFFGAARLSFKVTAPRRQVSDLT